MEIGGNCVLQRNSKKAITNLQVLLVVHNVLHIKATKLADKNIYCSGNKGATQSVKKCS